MLSLKMSGRVRTPCVPQDEHLSAHGGWHPALSSYPLSPLLLHSKSSGSAALLALTWTCLLVRIVFPMKAKRQGDIWNKLVGSLSLESWGSAFPGVFRCPSHPSTAGYECSAVGATLCSLAFLSGSV